MIHNFLSFFKLDNGILQKLLNINIIKNTWKKKSCWVGLIKLWLFFLLKFSSMNNNQKKKEFFLKPWSINFLWVVRLLMTKMLNENMKWFFKDGIISFVDHWKYSHSHTCFKILLSGPQLKTLHVLTRNTIRAKSIFVMYWMRQYVLLLRTDLYFSHLSFKATVIWRLF